MRSEGTRGPAAYYTADHYGTFVAIERGRHDWPRQLLAFVRPPWVVVLPSERVTDLRKCLTTLTAFRILTVDGRRCRSKRGLLTEFARKLEFPPYFGHRRDAFEDCLTDLAWLRSPGFVIVVEDADDLLANRQDDDQTFIDVLGSAGKYWATGEGARREAPVPFHALLLASKAGRGSRGWCVPLLELQLTA